MQLEQAEERRLVIAYFIFFFATGKSTLIIQFVEGQFVENYHPTIENTFHRVISYRGHEYQTDIVDTAGQVRHYLFSLSVANILKQCLFYLQDETSIFPTNCSVGIHGYILVYSITSKASLETCKVIHDKILDMIGANRYLNQQQEE